MSQVLSGLRLGPGFSILYGVGDPSASTSASVKGAALNYAFFRTDAPDSSHWLYVCTKAAVVSNGIVTTPAVWTAK
jgi:hypothetical protein